MVILTLWEIPIQSTAEMGSESVRRVQTVLEEFSPLFQTPAVELTAQWVVVVVGSQVVVDDAPGHLQRRRE